MSREITFAEAESCYSRAARAELDGDYDRAFKLYIKSAEDFIYLSSVANDAHGRSSNPGFTRDASRANAKRALERAEKIKKAKRDLTPVVRDYFSETEQMNVIRASSSVNGNQAAPWSQDYTHAASANITQPPLSREQLEHGASWRRQERATVASESSLLYGEDIAQNIVSDCSVCASISACVNHNHRFGSTLGLSSLHPQNPHGLPQATEDGSYSLKALFNGTYRRIDIDDQLPHSRSGDLLCVSTGDKGQIYPALIEKAYMKLMGGYEFAGSTSDVDLHVLTGWIPDFVDLRSSTFEREKTWSRIFNGFTQGLCVLTVGTGERIRATRDFPINLLPAHCYAVIDVQDVDFDRKMTVLDSQTIHLAQDPSATDEIPMERLQINDSVQPRSRSFELSWHQVCNAFDGIYLSWDPKMFRQSIQFHGIWKQEEGSDSDQPRHFQLSLKASAPPPSDQEEYIWVLLTRHVVDSTRQSEYISVSAQSKDSSDSKTLALKGAYTSSTHVTTKVPHYPSEELSIIASYDGGYPNVAFTITVYSSNQYSWVQNPIKLPYSEKATGSFASRTAGGNPTFSTFMHNPQWHLRVHPEKSSDSNAAGKGKKARVVLTAKSERRVPLNISVVWSKGEKERIAEIANNDLVVNSGAYTYGHSHVSKGISPGEYTVILSAFEPRHIGPFSLSVESVNKIELVQIPQEGAGMFSKPVQGSWAGESAAGGPSSKKYTLNPSFELNIPSQMHAKIRLQLAETGRTASMNVTLFHLTKQRTLGAHVATSGPYSDAISGVVTPQVLLQPGSYVIVPSTYAAGVEADFRLIVYTSGPNTSVSESPIVLGSKP